MKSKIKVKMAIYSSLVTNFKNVLIKNGFVVLMYGMPVSWFWQGER